MVENGQFSHTTSVFRTVPLPEEGILAGYTALIEAYDLQVPLPYQMAAIGKRHRVLHKGVWRLYTPRHQPAATLEGHLTFALRYEGLNLAILNRLFRACGAQA